MAGGHTSRAPHKLGGPAAAAKHFGPLQTQIHATTVALNGRGLLVVGASGSGKSGLALTLMAYGASLVADDRTDLTLQDGAVIASCPDPIAGQIEARGIGVLSAPSVGPCPVVLAVDLDQTEQDRLPQPRTLPVLGVPVPLYHKVDTDHFAAALMQYLKDGPARI